MQITKIQFIPTKIKDGHFGFVNFVLEEKFFIGSIAVYSRPNGNIRLVWPNIKYNGIQYPTIYPKNNNINKHIENIIYKKIKDILPI